MGLLLGDVIVKEGKSIARIMTTSVLARSDKKKDRVEISPEQLSAASTQAEKISEQTGIRTRVIGWYHSHPHITVLPSQIDIQTQAMYQMLDRGFIGLIFSCFYKETNKISRIQVTAFQSIDTSSITDVIDLNDDNNTTMSSNNNRSNNGYQQIEIPLRIISTESQTPPVLDKLVRLQSILLDEEKSSFENAILQNREHPMGIIHHSAVYEKSICRLLELETMPILTILDQKHSQNLHDIDLLLHQKRLLESKLSLKKVKY